MIEENSYLSPIKTCYSRDFFNTWWWNERGFEKRWCQLFILQPDQFRSFWLSYNVYCFNSTKVLKRHSIKVLYNWYLNIYTFKPRRVTKPEQTVFVLCIFYHRTKTVNLLTYLQVCISCKFVLFDWLISAKLVSFPMCQRCKHLLQHYYPAYVV